MPGQQATSAVSALWRRIHMVGIGGAGMGALAEVLLRMGCQVSGSDCEDSSMVQRMRALGARVHVGHAPRHVEGAEGVVVSSAVSRDNPEWQRAVALGLPVQSRAAMLSTLMQRYTGVAVGGTHGKTTTTGLIASLLATAGHDPTCVMGGKHPAWGAHARWGQGPFFVAEADESDGSLVCLRPKVVVITNIDADHLSTYRHDITRLQSVVSDWINSLPNNGLAVLGVDDPGVRAILERVERPYLGYGESDDADFKLTYCRLNSTHSVCHVQGPSGPLGWQLNMPGQHNAHNALAAAAVGYALGVSMGAMESAFSNFQGMERRFQQRGPFACTQHDGTYHLVDDYGHHPTELAAMLQSMRKLWPNAPLNMVFQPHRYSRTLDVFDAFVDVLSQVDRLWLLPVYAAGEPALEGATSVHLADAIAKRGGVQPVLLDHVDATHDAVAPCMRPGDVLMMQGAGSIGRASAAWT